MRKIGITFNSPENAIGMFSNGIRQNALYFAKLLLNIGYDVELIIGDSSLNFINGIYGFEEYKTCRVIDIFNVDWDLIVQFGQELPDIAITELRKKRVKLVQYNCGNDFIYDVENLLHGTSDVGPQFTRFNEKVFDQIWSIPQMTNTNQHYWQTLYKTETIEVPFIWSPIAIDSYENDCIKSGIGELGWVKKDKVNIAIFEPNVNIFKWAFPALLVCENAYTSGSNIDHVWITNILNNKKFNLKFFNQVLKQLSLFKDGKISIESRYNTLYFMKEYASIAVSFQWENPLNYLYLDLAWKGWPILHNAHLCPDIGYYYKDFNYKMGGEVLSKIIKNHDVEEYKYKNKKLINRYLPDNDESMNSYKRIIENLFK